MSTLTPVYLTAAIRKDYFYEDVPSLRNALKTVERDLQAANDTHSQNLPLIEENLAARERFATLAGELGIPETHKVRDERSRKKVKPILTVKSGWVQDLDRVFPVDDGYENFLRAYGTTKRKLLGLIGDAEAAAEKKEKDAKMTEYKEAKERERNVNLASVIIKHNLPYSSTREEVVEYIYNASPLLRLADAMLATREDWSEGFWRVENALEYLTDYQEIYNRVSEVLHSGEEDGRVFRDMEYNYNVLFDLADQELRHDLALISQYS